MSESPTCDGTVAVLQYFSPDHDHPVHRSGANPKSTVDHGCIAACSLCLNAYYNQLCCGHNYELNYMLTSLP